MMQRCRPQWGCDYGDRGDWGYTKRGGFGLLGRALPLCAHCGHPPGTSVNMEFIDRNPDGLSPMTIRAFDRRVESEQEEIEVGSFVVLRPVPSPLAARVRGVLRARAARAAYRAWRETLS